VYKCKPVPEESQRIDTAGLFFGSDGE